MPQKKKTTPKEPKKVPTRENKAVKEEDLALIIKAFASVPGKELKVSKKKKKKD